MNEKHAKTVACNCDQACHGTNGPTPLLLNPEGPIPTLALRPREAAKALAISERTLWTLTKGNKVPHVRLGKAILYPVEALREWLKVQVAPTNTKSAEPRPTQKAQI